MYIIADIFDPAEVKNFEKRIQNLDHTTQAKWRKMNVAQMLAHCNVTYELVYENNHPKPGPVQKFFLKWLAKKVVVGAQPYRRHAPTASYFKVASQQDFELQKQKLIRYLYKTMELGKANFEGKESHSFGPLTSEEWNNMFSKHLDHHLTQFGV